MRHAWVFAVLVACGGGGESIPFEQCDHTTLESTCCVTAQSCGNDRCLPPEPRTVTGFCSTDEDCSEGEFCDPATSQCDEIVCATSVDCPPDFDCPAGACQRHACEVSEECSAFCVEGQCYQRAGECQ
jgi:hypothetical protein